MKINDIVIVTAYSSSTLEYEIKKCQDIGYVLHGTVFAYRDCYAQAMIRYENEVNPLNNSDF